MKDIDNNLHFAYPIRQNDLKTFYKNESYGIDTRKQFSESSHFRIEKKNLNNLEPTNINILIDAMLAGDLDQAYLLIDDLDNINEIDQRHGKAAIHVAAALRNRSLVQKLLQRPDLDLQIESLEGYKPWEYPILSELGADPPLSRYLAMFTRKQIDSDAQFDYDQSPEP